MAAHVRWRARWRPPFAARATALRSQATSDLLVTSAATLLLLSLVVLVSTVVARSLVRPLRKLRLDALDVASHRLPEIVRRLSESEGAGDGVEIEPIGVTSTDEIGEVARAFDQVHQEAVRLAAHEAMLRGNLNAMFVNLSRRSQALVERQLGIIDALEQSEQDSDRLSSLFRLDHLATRMRRNSENLLVLAGHEDARKWSQPVSLVDAIRAAISEIEQYERIVVNIQPGVLITGRAATDVVRLTAELVENAATFSPDSTQVLVTGQQLASGGVLIEVTDRGLGIADQELEYANWRLDNPPVIDVDVSRRMGLFVVGRLAARHGIRVRLRRIQPCGLSALVWLPETVAEPETVTAIVPAPTAARRTVASDWFIGEATAARLPRRTPNGNRLAEFQRGGCPGHRRMLPVRPEQRLLAGRGCGLRGWRPARHAHRQRIDVPAHLPGGGHLGLQVGPAWHRGQLRRHRLGQGPRPPGRGHSWLRRLRHPDPARRAGRIKAWDDPAIEADNPAATLPATAITLAVRSDSSGTTNNFTNFLVRAAGSAWTLGSGSTITWPAGSVAGRSNSGVAQIVKSTPGAIGYVDYATAKASGLTFASVMNKDGHFVAPSPASAAAAAGQATPAANGTFSAIWAGGALSYPITYQSFDLVYAKQPNANDAKMLRAYLGYLLGAGQELLPQLGYAPLPSSIDQQAQAQLSKIGV